VDTDVDTDHLPSKRRRTQSTTASSRAVATLSQHSEYSRNSPSPSIHDDDVPGTSQAKSTQRSHGKSTGKRDPPPPPEQASEMTATEVRVLKTELAKARADAAGPQQLLHWRRSVSRQGLAGASIDFIRVGILFVFLC
jgi:hypothetical protein